MSRPAAHDIIPFDRFWRGGHPMRATTSTPRRWCMISLLLMLCGLIGGYAYLTNSNRVRVMAESYLSQILGGQVQVRKATLSVFEGLRLEDVKVRLAGAPLDQPPIFSADTFVVRYSLHQLLAGRIEATQIIAKRPHVQLTEDLDSLLGQYRKVVGDGPSLNRPAPGSPGRPLPLPEISLRDARVDYRELRPDGTTSFGTLALEGQFSPAEGGDRYEFRLQTRGMSEKLGPSVRGSIYPAVGRVTAELLNFELGSDIRLMLPGPVRQWWEQHELAGQIDITDLSYVLPRAGQRDAKFTVKTRLQGVTLVVRPGELMSSDEAARVASVRDTINTMAGMYRAGGHTGLGPMSPMESQFTSAPIRLDDMAGTFTFTEAGITVENAHGDVEGNRIYIDGQVDGYPGQAGTPEPPARLTITSGGHKLTLPPEPAYTNSLPHAVREIYDQLRPQGSCTIDVKVARPTAGGKIVVDGVIEVLDGNFTFLRFPYPVRNATGHITFAPADGNAPERLELNLTGMGIAGGPNDKTVVTVAGLMGPLGNDAGVAIRISCDDAYSEPALTFAFPSEVQRALKLFDADGTGLLPTFHGRFTCDVNRAVGPFQPWLLSTHVVIDSAKGKMEAFPYPVENLAVELKIGEDHVDIINAHTTRGDATLRVDGKVTWAPTVPVRFGQRPKIRRTRPSTVTNLTIQAKNLPIDEDLLGALPPDKRRWLSDVGISGKLDLSGTIRSDASKVVGATTMPDDTVDLSTNAASIAPVVPPMEYDLDVTLRDGTVWPATGAFAVAGVGGRMRISPTQIRIVDVTGTRGEGTLKANGAISFGSPGGGGAKANVNVIAENLAMDAPLYALLPKAGQEAWDQLRPKGTLDFEVGIAGPIGSSSAVTTTTAPTTSPATPTTKPTGGMRQRVVLKPRKLSVHPRVFPYKLDGLTGRVVIDEGKTTLHQVSGRHGDGLLSVWGESETIGNSDVWNVTLFARGVTADEELIAAMPTALATSLRDMKLKGKVGWYAPRFVYSVPKGVSDPAKASIDLSGKISLGGADMDVGVQLADVMGSVSGRATVTGGEFTDVHGTIDFASLKIADRDMTDLHAAIDRDAGSDVLRISKMGAELAGGDLAGDVTLTSPKVGPGKYGVDLVLRDADAAAIAQLDDGGDGKNTDIKGRLSASLSLEGTTGDPASRRGRGDVLVNGKDMYNLPVVMGLLQITNLALPITSPFNEASARYNVEGQRITFENILLKSNTMAMQGTGHLDFDTRKVALTFTTDNPNAPKIPFISELWRNAQQELFKIQVRGTVQDPKVSANSFGTFSTTVDEVFGANEKR